MNTNISSSLWAGCWGQRASRLCSHSACPPGAEPALCFLSCAFWGRLICVWWSGWCLEAFWKLLFLLIRDLSSLSVVCHDHCWAAGLLECFVEKGGLRGRLGLSRKERPPEPQTQEGTSWAHPEQGVMRASAHSGHSGATFHLSGLPFPWEAYPESSLSRCPTHTPESHWGDSWCRAPDSPCVCSCSPPQQNLLRTQADTGLCGTTSLPGFTPHLCTTRALTRAPEACMLWARLHLWSSFFSPVPGPLSPRPIAWPGRAFNLPSPCGPVRGPHCTQTLLGGPCISKVLLTTSTLWPLSGPSLVLRFF